MRIYVFNISANGQEIPSGGTISLGLAAYPANASSGNELVEKSKQALTRAKICGGNRVCFYQGTDPLTGLLNKYASYRALDEAITRARQSGEPLSVFLLDIDQFKQINDDYGRTGGDEFIVINLIISLAMILADFPRIGNDSSLISSYNQI